MRCRLVVREFMITTSSGCAPTRAAESALTTSSMVIHGLSVRKWPSTPCSSHLSSSSSTYLRTPRGWRPSELPQRYTLAPPFSRMRASWPVRGNRNSPRSSASSSSPSINSAKAALDTSSPARAARSSSSSPGCELAMLPLQCTRRRHWPHHCQFRDRSTECGGRGTHPKVGRWEKETDSRCGRDRVATRGRENCSGQGELRQEAG